MLSLEIQYCRKWSLINAALLLLMAWVPAGQAQEVFPAYKRSSRSPAPMDIRLNAYGASRDAPAALGIGDAAPDFAAPRAGGGIVTSRTLRRQGPLVIVFYRGHW